MRDCILHKKVGRAGFKPIGTCLENGNQDLTLNSLKTEHLKIAKDNGTAEPFFKVTYAGEKDKV